MERDPTKAALLGTDCKTPRDPREVQPSISKAPEQPAALTGRGHGDVIQQRRAVGGQLSLCISQAPVVCTRALASHSLQANRQLCRVPQLVPAQAQRRRPADTWSASALTLWLALALPGSQADAAEPNGPAGPLHAASTEIAQQSCGPAIGCHPVGNLYGRVLCAIAGARVPLTQG